MASRARAKRYSQAIFQIAMQKDELDKWESDLDKIAGLSKDASITALLENPKLQFDDKTRLLSEQLAGINPLAMNLVYLLVSRGALNMTREIADEYRLMLDSHRGIERAEVKTAIPLAEEDKLKLEERLGSIFDKKILIKSEVDSSLLGGVVARVGGKLIDGSTRTRLEALKKELSKARG